MWRIFHFFLRLCSFILRFYPLLKQNYFLSWLFLFFLFIIILSSLSQVKFKLKIDKNKAGTNITDDADVCRELKKQVKKKNKVSEGVWKENE